MSIASVAASIAALRQQPAPAPLRSGATSPSAPAQERPRGHRHEGKADVVTASTVAAKQGELLNTLV